MGGRIRGGGWRGVLLVLACVCFVLQPGLLPLHLILHHDAAAVSDHDDLHHHAGLGYFHPHSHDHGHEHEIGDLGEDPEPHPAEDHLTEPDLVGARRPSLDIEFDALPTSTRTALAPEGPASALEPTARDAPRPPPPRGAHRARAPPAFA